MKDTRRNSFKKNDVTSPLILLDYSSESADLSLSIMLKSCAAQLFYRAGEYEKSIGFLVLASECIKKAMVGFYSKKKKRSSINRMKM